MASKFKNRVKGVSKSNPAGGSDGRFFSTTKKGETHELRQELASQNGETKKDAVKKVIANMTVGKDVSMLFPDVINCIQTDNIELKKLVYLYLINYAKSQPDLTLLAVNTFVKDASDPNPLIRALAVRTMGCIRVDKITEYLCEPLSRALRDEDPYVRKTAAVCVAKLFDIAPEMVQDRGFLDILRDLISDSNPTVVANAVAALSEIGETSGRDVMQVSTSVLQKLLAALNECTEWGQVYILDALAKHTPEDSREAQSIIERVTPRLQHANSAVVMSAVKVVLSYMSALTDDDFVRTLCRKLAPPLVTLLNAQPEMQYVALRNINLIVQKFPKILEHEIKVFFCKYNDPIYVKMEKLEIIIRLATERNIDQVLLEFKEYATEVDVEFIRRAVRAIGRCAIKLERAAERCINVLLELIQTKVNYVVQEAVIVIKDIFRKYPNRYESIIATLCENLDTLDEPEAKASMVWIIGEYADRIDNADELLDAFLETFDEETAQVQLQLLTATVKLFLKQPDDTQDMVQRVLTMATEDSDNPDLRDRGYVYWRLLSTNPDAAKAVVLSDKPTIADDTFTLETSLLDLLIGQIATLASIYHKPPEAFVICKTGSALPASTTEDEEDEESVEASSEEEYEDEGEDEQKEAVASNGVENTGDLLDLLSMDDPAPQPGPAGGMGGGADLLGGAPAAVVQKPVVCTAEQGQGIQIAAAFANRNSQIMLEMDFVNQSPVPVASLAIQLNKSSFGITPAQQQIVFQEPLQPGGQASYSLPMVCTPQMVGQGPPSLEIQAAIKNMSSGSVFYFRMNINFEAILSPDGQLDRQSFINAWKSIDDSRETYCTVTDMPTVNVESISQKLSSTNIFYIARREVPNMQGQEVVYFSTKTMTNLHFLIELTFRSNVHNACKLCIKTQAQGYETIAMQTVERLLK
mmetsp:Transcript_4652/g.6090  ORF Transcript_4652/g.6090 Transcript_4652/m.6090 type:complete len:923 (-) Transcript_4652:252-3020(-)